ncbi:MAG: Ig-like domain-containing protein [Deltaproteobacteria bacterium]|nr:Ig-like domain-containing protein [Deltaproteobacteria bacterium]
MKWARRRARAAAIFSLATFLACGSPPVEEHQFGELPEPLTTAICLPGTNIIEGTDADDIINGTAGDDCILGGRGNDTIRGGDGDDWIYSASGNDDLDGEAGNDHLWGGAGNDLLRGGPGKDEAFGQQGSDDIGGGLDRDIVGGGAGDDVVHGDEGQDNVYGHEGNDFIYGDDGSDQMWGGPGNDSIFGGAGFDTIRGGTGSDTIDSGQGVDRSDGNEECDVIDGTPDGECPTTCGNSELDAGESCDDGNIVSGDGCSSACVTEFCGDGVVQAGLGEVCDDGNTSNSDACLDDCVPTQRLLSQADVRPGSVIRRAIDQGNIAYLATGPGGMECVDVTDPFNTVLLGQYTEAGLDCTDIIKDDAEDIAYVACGAAGVKCVNVSNPAAPTLVGTIPSNCTTLTRQGNALYCAVGNDLEIWDISNPLSPFLVRTLFSGNTSGLVRIVVDGGRIYCLFRDGTVIVNDGDGFNPSFVTSFGGPANATDLVVQGGIAYCGYNGGGLYIFDWRDLFNRVQLFWDGGSPTTGIAVRGGVLSCIYGNGRFYTAGLRDLTRPELLGGSLAGSPPTAVSVFRSGYAFCGVGRTAAYLDVPPFVLHTSPLGGTSGICAGAGIDTQFSSILGPSSTDGVALFTGGGAPVPSTNTVSGNQIRATPNAPLPVGTYEVRTTSQVTNARGTQGVPFRGTFDVAPVCTDFNFFPGSVIGGTPTGFGWAIFGGSATSSELWISTDPNPASPFATRSIVSGSGGPELFQAAWITPVVSIATRYYVIARFVSGGLTYFGPIRSFLVVPGCPAGTADCNGDLVCETQLGSIDNCSGCGDVCGAGESCVNGSCQVPQPSGCNVVVEKIGPFRRIHAFFDETTGGPLKTLSFLFEGSAFFAACGFEGQVGLSGLSGTPENIAPGPTGCGYEATPDPSLRWTVQFAALALSGRFVGDYEYGPEVLPTKFVMNGFECGFTCFGPDCPTAAVCGNGIVEPGEECDEGPANGGPVCNLDCTLVPAPVCGNGVVEAGEGCDDGNSIDTDACLNSCVVASCGDGFTQVGVEECDEGAANGGPDCNLDCTIPTSGFTICKSNVGLATIDSTTVQDFMPGVPQGVTITDLDVYVNASHVHPGNLSMVVMNIDGPLAHRKQIKSSDFDANACITPNIDATFDDEASVSATGMCNLLAPAVSGRVIPSTSLDTFDGRSTSGEWWLLISDTATGGTGVLNEWCLTFNTTAAPVCGNGVVEAGEECDQGAANGTGTCSVSCTIVSTGLPDVGVAALMHIDPSDASSIVQGGGFVVQANDLTGNFMNLNQLSPVLPPPTYDPAGIGGLGALRFNNSGPLGGQLPNFTNVFTTFVVFRVNSFDTWSWIVGDDSFAWGTGWGLELNGSELGAFMNSSPQGGRVNISDSQTYVMAVEFDGAAIKLYTDASATAATTDSTTIGFDPNPYRFTIGSADTIVEAWGLDGWIGETVAYAEALSDAQRATIFNYLLGKWAPAP